MELVVFYFGEKWRIFEIFKMLLENPGGKNTKTVSFNEIGLDAAGIVVKFSFISLPARIVSSVVTSAYS